MADETNCCQTKNKRRGRGRPTMPGQSVRFTVRLREGVHDEILKRLKKVPERGKSAYIRRVLEGAPVEALERALIEDDETADGLDGMWSGDWDLDEEQ